MYSLRSFLALLDTPATPTNETVHTAMVHALRVYVFRDLSNAEIDSALSALDLTTSSPV